MVDKPAVLVTGGAGYIGAHVVLALRDAGWPLIVLDDLSTGHRQAVPPDVPFAQGDVGDRALVDQVLRGHAVGAVVHLAGSISVPDSITEPLAYYRNNTISSHTLIDASIAAGVRAWIFSSTAAVYGDPDRIPVREDAPTRPLSPYGWSKLMTEQILRDADRAHGLPHVILRYFNVAGADPAGRAGPATPGAAHLLKVACEVAVGRRAAVPLFGEDYPTADGTCVRDFIHVSDLADAHLKALEHLLAGGAGGVFNCGYGRGFSVREVLDAVARVSGRPLAIAPAPRRPGDAVAIIAAADRIRAVLGWRPRHADLMRIVADALAFERRLHGRAEGVS